MVAVPKPGTSDCAIAQISCGEMGRPAASMTARIAARWRVLRSWDMRWFDVKLKQARFCDVTIMGFHYH